MGVMRQLEMSGYVKSEHSRIRVASCGQSWSHWRHVLLAGCGGDFDYKISGDRIQDETRGNTGEF